MAITLNSATPAAISGSTNVTWQKDGSGNVSAYVGPGLPIDLGCFVPGVGTNNQILLSLALNRAITFPAGATLSHAIATIAATGSTTFTFKKNGSSFATAVFAGSGTTATFTQASDAVFVAGDILEIDGPATADATLANIGITLAGVRA